jgi:hypothetical protein
MNQPTTMQEAAHELACTFEVLTGRRPRVAINATREADGTRLIAVAYVGDELVRAMQIEAFLVEKGERILHRSQQRNGQTILAYYLVPKAAPAMGGFHLSTVKPPRIVPASERHKWSGPARRQGCHLPAVQLRENLQARLLDHLPYARRAGSHRAARLHWLSDSVKNGTYSITHPLPKCPSGHLSVLG